MGPFFLQPQQNIFLQRFRLSFACDRGAGAGAACEGARCSEVTLGSGGFGSLFFFLHLQQEKSDGIVSLFFFTLGGGGGPGPFLFLNQGSLQEHSFDLFAGRQHPHNSFKFFLLLGRAETGWISGELKGKNKIETS